LYHADRKDDSEELGGENRRPVDDLKKLLDPEWSVSDLVEKVSRV